MLKSAIYGERDPILGVSANIMLGAPIRAGTAFTDVLFDEERAIELKKDAPKPPSEVLEALTALSQEEIEARMYASEGTYSSMLKIAATVPDLPEGFTKKDELFDDEY
jgi:hypothetical protein